MPHHCSRHLDRRAVLQAAGASGLTWLTPLATNLSRAAEKDRRAAHAKSVIILFLQGGPSQLETFDPHPGTRIAAGTRAVNTNVAGVKFAAGLPQSAEHMDKISLVRSVTSQESDHERGVYNLKTGYQPDPTLIHPSIGSVICHQTLEQDAGQIDIPRHVSILPSNFPPRGGFLGDRYDAFKIGDPINPVPDIRKRVSEARFRGRLHDLRKIVEPEFVRGRRSTTPEGDAPNSHLTDAAVRMMSAEQLSAFEVSQEPQAILDEFGDTPFGRGCLTAIRLVESGVRCVEVSLGGWDSHVNNHSIHEERVGILDPAFASLLKHLAARDLLDDTVVACFGEFGRSPNINPAGGREHWPHGFSVALAGGGIQGGRVIGQTSPTPKLDKQDRLQDLKDPVRVEDVHASIYHALGIDTNFEHDAPFNRFLRICEGSPIQKLFA